MRYSSTLLFSFICCNCLFLANVFSQPTITLSKTVGSSGTESIHDLIADQDGHIIALGQCDSVDRDTSCHYHGGSTDIWLVKMDAAGNILWQKCYGGSKADFAYQIIQTADSGFLFTGWSYSQDGDITVYDGSFFTWLVKIDSNGNIQWQQGLSGGQPYHLMQLHNRKYLVHCYTVNITSDFPVHYGGGFNEDAWIWILSETGEKDTSFHYGGSDDDYITEVIEMPDGDWQMFGYTSSTDYDLEGTTAYGNWDGWILRTDSNGVIQWQNRLGDGGSNSIIGAVQLPGGGFLAAGNTANPDIWVIKLDSSGNKIAEYAYGGGGTDAMDGRLRIHKAAGDKFVLGAVTNSWGGDVGMHYGLFDFWFLTVDSNGLLIDSKVAGGSLDDYPSTNELFDNWIAQQAGYTQSSDFDIQDYHGNGDGWIIKIENFTAIDEASPHASEVKIFPNPATDIASVYMNMATLQESKSLEIFSIDGQFLCSCKIGKSSNQFSVDGISSGLYLFQLRGKAGQILGCGNFLVQ